MLLQIVINYQGSVCMLAIRASINIFPNVFLLVWIANRLFGFLLKGSSDLLTLKEYILCLQLKEIY